MDNKIISLDEYLNFRRNYRLIKVDTVKSTIEKYKIGEFSGKSEEEVQKFYEDLTDRLNDMIEHPCGATAFEVSKIITENNINTKDFDIIFDMIKTTDKANLESKEEKLDVSEIEKFFEEEEKNENKVPIVDLSDLSDEIYEENSIDYQQALEEEKFKREIEEDFLDDIDSGLDDYVDNIEFEEEYEKSSKPYNIVSKLSKSFKTNIEKLKENHEFKFTTPKIAEKLALVFAKAKNMVEISEENKPKIKFNSKKVINFKFKKSKGFMERAYQKAQSKKFENTREVIEEAKLFSDLLVKTYKEKSAKLSVNLNSIKNADLRDDIEYVRNPENTNLQDIAELRINVEDEYLTHIDYLREALDDIVTGKLKTDLANQTKLTDEEINQLLYGYTGLKTDDFYTQTSNSTMLGIDENGNLQISKKSPLNIEEIKGTELEEELRRYAMIPNIRELKDYEILQLSKIIKVQDGKIRVNFGYLFDGKTPYDISWTSKKVPIFANKAPESKTEWNKYLDAKRTIGDRLQLFKNLYGQEFYLKGMENILPDAFSKFESMEVYEQILQELDALEDLEKTKILSRQIQFLDDKAIDLEESKKLTKKQKHTRSYLRKIATRKIFELRDQGLSIGEKIDENGKVGEKVLLEARSKLNLEKIISADSKEINKIKSQDEQTNPR